jgi:2-polyprenyl-6-methoxyphenol hydroxylase-like FAD-dependent oxidoreductase
MNLAFQDAEALALRLGAARAPDESFVDSAARSYAAARRGAVAAVFRRTHLGAKLAGMTRPGPIEARRQALRIVDRISPVKRFVLGQMIGAR